MPKISILVPAYNEEASILETLERVGGQSVDGVQFEVIVIDDGSTDATVEKLQSRPELYTILIRQPRNGGKGAAIKAGLAAASGEYILFQDADLEYDPADYPGLLMPVVRFDAEIVMGSRMVGAEFTRVHYFWHQLGNRLITLLFNVLNNTTFTDIYCGYLVCRRDLIDATPLRTEGWEQQAEILSRAVGKAQSVYEVPVTYHGRTYQQGKKIRAHHVIPVIWTIVRERLKF